MNQVFLIGFMGCGKSTLGKSLAEISGYQFIDLDRHIEEGEQQKIGDIFQRHGEEYFRQLERQYLLRCLTSQKTIIAVGCGAPCYHDNIDLMNNSGTSVYIDVPAHILLYRLMEHKQGRPLIAHMSKVDLMAFIEDSLKKREPFYRKAKLHIHDPEKELSLILQHMQRE
jgi:shikimate kinase